MLLREAKEREVRCWAGVEFSKVNAIAGARSGTQRRSGSPTWKVRNNHAMARDREWAVTQRDAVKSGVPERERACRVATAADAVPSQTKRSPLARSDSNRLIGCSAIDPTRRIEWTTWRVRMWLGVSRGAAGVVSRREIAQINSVNVTAITAMNARTAIMPSMGCDMGLPRGGRRPKTSGACLRRGVRNARTHHEQHEAENPKRCSGSRSNGARVIEKGRGGYRSTPKKTSVF